jgi:thiosulfate/3-mercaptopyruvate sulfurtransferase
MTSAIGSTGQDDRSTSDVLVGPEWLAVHLDDPAVRVIEVDVSPTDYNGGHIDGATLWNVYRDLKDAHYRSIDRRAVAALLGRSGIDPTSTVVFYGYAPALGFWLLKLYGHRNVRILDGGRRAWAAAGRPWTTELREPTPTQYVLPDHLAPIRADQPMVYSVLDHPDTTILDVRTDLEFRGERFWPSGGQEPGGRAGHIPKAVNLRLDGILDELGRFRSEAELRSIFKPFDTTNNDIITYCTIGGRASTAWFVLTYLIGRNNVLVYDGSWAEWGLLPTAPVSSGIATPAADEESRKR